MKHTKQQLIELQHEHNVHMASSLYGKNDTPTFFEDGGRCVITDPLYMTWREQFRGRHTRYITRIVLNADFFLQKWSFEVLTYCTTSLYYTLLKITLLTIYSLIIM